MSYQKPKVPLNVQRVIDAYGGVRKMADALGVSEEDVRGYWRIPADLVEQVSRETGISRFDLKPEW
jgi:hypothetical protein